MTIYQYQGRSNLCGERIRAARKLRRMTQTELAAKMQTAEISITQDGISRIEKGTRFVPDYELPLYARFLSVSLEWLLGLTDCLN